MLYLPCFIRNGPLIQKTEATKLDTVEETQLKQSGKSVCHKNHQKVLFYFMNENSTAQYSRSE